MVMKSGVSRGLEGIDDDTRAAAQEAARQAGMTLGQWLEQAIADRAAEEGLRRDAEDDIAAREDREVDAVAESIARLTRRIHAMEPAARSAVTGLSGRLDEIEAQLGRAQTVDVPGERRSRSLKGVTDMVDRLAREIDDADETARSMVEGQKAKIRPAPRRAGSGRHRRQRDPRARPPHRRRWPSGRGCRRPPTVRPGSRISATGSMPSSRTRWRARRPAPLPRRSRSTRRCARSRSGSTRRGRSSPARSPPSRRFRPTRTSASAGSRRVSPTSTAASPARNPRRGRSRRRRTR